MITVDERPDCPAAPPVPTLESWWRRLVCGHHGLAFPGGSVYTERQTRSGAVASWGERLLCKQEVVGSTPAGSMRT